MKQHYYNFTFIDSSTGEILYGNCYVGLDNQQVTLAVIAFARLRAKLTDNATMVDCSYLGYMTAEEFNAPL